MTSVIRRTVGALIAAVVSVLWIAGTAVPSHAAPASQTAIPAGATGSLTIHKLVGPTLDQSEHPATGAPITLPVGVVPVAGVVFTVSQVEGVDLSTTAGRAAAQEYLEDLGSARENLGRSWTTAATNTQGQAVLRDLPVGLYLVHEQAAHAADGSIDPRLVGGRDFLVTIPTSDPVTGAWNYDVHVYPKNSSVEITKTVRDGNLGVDGEDAPTAGSVLTYEIAADIPHDGLRVFGGRCLVDGAVASGGDLDEHGFGPDGMCAAGASFDATGAAYEIIDDLSTAVVPGVSPQQHTSDFLEFQAADWAGSVQVSLTGAGVLTACAAPGDSGCDYTLTQTSERVVVSMTAAGLTKMAAAKADDGSAQVRVQIQARVRDAVVTALTQTDDGRSAAVPVAVLTLPNTAVLIPTGPAQDAGTHVPSNPVRTIYGTLKVHKLDASDQRPLAGAVFTLYRTEADALAGRAPVAVSAPTNAAGMTQIPGLHVNDLQNDGPATDSYWLVETTVPEGYTASGEPIQVRVLSDGRTEGADVTLGVPVPNHPEGEEPPPTTPPPSEPPPTTPPTTPPGPPSKPPPLAWTGMELSTTLLIGAGLMITGMLFVALTRRRKAHAPGAR
ncbi:MAG: SpaH/EbpB family LPXTG-anchored major pilin [Actinomycetia bacterium]|nr:SpaH/EbpB family LPXTG-anchored major pilin [Actinomycetes bacterium]